MKYITAVIKPFKLEDVREALVPGGVPDDGLGPGFERIPGRFSHGTDFDQSTPSRGGRAAGKQAMNGRAVIAALAATAALLLPMEVWAQAAAAAPKVEPRLD